MKNLLIIGAGGVGQVVSHKASQLNFFDNIALASRTLKKCEQIATLTQAYTAAKGNTAVKAPEISTFQLDADKTEEVISVIEKTKPSIVVHVALPYQDLSIMRACLETRVPYLDTANYESEDCPGFEYKKQWEMHNQYKENGITAILGCGFDPGVTNIFTAYCAKHFFDEIHFLDIVDCNGGDHGKAFATNFNPEINIREITQRGKYFEDGKWVYTDPMQVHQAISYPEIGSRESYLLYHEELESLVKNFPSLKRARFWMTFSEDYLKHLEILENVGMTSIKPITYEGKDIVPLKFLTAVLPKPGELGKDYTGSTSIGCYIRGLKDGKEKTVYIYNNCSHEKAYKETGTQAVPYTTGVPATLGAKLFVEGKWPQTPGVFNVEQFDPDPFMEELPSLGLTWQVVEDAEYPFG